MTSTAGSAEKMGIRLPSQGERDAASQLRQIFSAHTSPDNNNSLTIIEPSGDPAKLVLMPALAELLVDLLDHISNGDAVTIVPVNQVLTTQQAAAILNVSLPYFVGLLQKGEIECSQKGRHRCVKAADVFAYKSTRDSARASALDELAKTDSDLI